MELPGFRERVCHIRLTPQEGGLNLNMNATTIAGLLARGREAWQLIIDEFAWPQQLWERFRMLSSLLELNLQQAGEPATWTQYAAMLNNVSGLQYPYAEGVDAAWAAAAKSQLDQLFRDAAAWGHGDRVSMTQGELPQPTPVMHVAPDV